MKQTLFLLIIALFLLSSCSKLESIGYDAGEKLGSKLLGEDDSSTDLGCIAQAKELTPDQVTLFLLNDQWYLKEFSFTDGTLDPSVSIRYRAGDKEGENVNYYYSANLVESNTLSYHEQIVDEQGVIKGDFSFEVTLILKKTTESEQTLADTKYGKEITSQTFDVVQGDYDRCTYP
ncbi:MAG: hypothetical protein KC535_02255 [Nanoarchaeota archaeon]|nr:hypothetical protein [Nanoarchaeota archaeon]